MEEHVVVFKLSWPAKRGARQRVKVEMLVDKEDTELIADVADIADAFALIARRCSIFAEHADQRMVNNAADQALENFLGNLAMAFSGPRKDS